MSLSVNDHYSQVPPGFRFHPTEEELLHCYLRKKVAHEKTDLDVMRDIDLNKLEPWDIQEKCKVGSIQNDWYFFSHKDKKYPTGTRTNRATAAGFWKATGRDKAIYSSCKRIGMRKTLVFYKGRAPYGQKSDWIMHEYRLDNQQKASYSSGLSVWKSSGQATQEEEWVVCHMFKKRKYHKAKDIPKSSAITIEAKTQIDGALDQIFQYMGGSYKQENEAIMNNNDLNIHTITATSTDYNSNHGNMRFLRPTEINTNNGPQERLMHLSALVSENCGSQACYPLMDDDGQMLLDAALGGGGGCTGHLNPVYHSELGWSDWAALDRLVASHLNGQVETCNARKHLACLNERTMIFSSPAPLLPRENDDDQGGLLPSTQLRSSNPSTTIFNTSRHNTNDYNSEINLWNFIKSPSSSSDPLCHVSNTSW